MQSHEFDVYEKRQISPHDNFRETCKKEFLVQQRLRYWNIKENILIPVILAYFLKNKAFQWLIL